MSSLPLPLQLRERSEVAVQIRRVTSGCEPETLDSDFKRQTLWRDGAACETLFLLCTKVEVSKEAVAVWPSWASN